jgi:putative ABC transport system permease protein
VKDSRAYRFITVKLRPGSLFKSIEQVKARWKEVSPMAPFEFLFMDDKLQSMYKSELQLKKASGIATGLMLMIILMGIFGVLALALSKRTREIAVRKVLGAEIHNILSLFIKQYAALMLISNFIAWPVTYYFSNRWLNQYAYRIVQSVSVYFCSRHLRFGDCFYFDLFTMSQSCISKSGEKPEGRITTGQRVGSAADRFIFW